MSVKVNVLIGRQAYCLWPFRYKVNSWLVAFLVSSLILLLSNGSSRFKKGVILKPTTRIPRIKLSIINNRNRIQKIEGFNGSRTAARKEFEAMEDTIPLMEFEVKRSQIEKDYQSGVYAA